MTLAELLARLERQRAEAEALEATAPVANVYAQVIRDLRSLDGVPAIEAKVNTRTAAQLEGVDRSTIAKRCGDGWYPNAEKTSGGGEWRIPLSDLRSPTRPRQPGRGPTTPTLLQGGA